MTFWFAWGVLCKLYVETEFKFTLTSSKLLSMEEVILFLYVVLFFCLLHNSIVYLHFMQNINLSTNTNVFRTTFITIRSTIPMLPLSKTTLVLSITYFPKYSKLNFFIPRNYLYCPGLNIANYFNHTFILTFRKLIDIW